MCQHLLQIYSQRAVRYPQSHRVTWYSIKINHWWWNGTTSIVLYENGCLPPSQWQLNHNRVMINKGSLFHHIHTVNKFALNQYIMVTSLVVYCMLTLATVKINGLLELKMVAGDSLLRSIKYAVSSKSIEVQFLMHNILHNMKKSIWSQLFI